MQNIRVFIAVSLPLEIQTGLTLITNQLKRDLGDGIIHWAKPSNIHLTLRFLGEISSGNIASLNDHLLGPVGSHFVFNLTVQNVGIFPNVHRPRIVWAGIKESPRLRALYNTVVMITNDLGYEPDNRPFSAHMTLGRVNPSASSNEIKHCGEIIAKSTVGVIGSFIVKSVDIYRSELNAGGSIYTKLHYLPLKKESIE